MKKVFAIIAVVLLACLSLTGLYTGGETALAATGDYGDVTNVVEPQSVHANGQTYYRIVSDGSGSAMQKWRWVSQNLDSINDNTQHVIIEEDLDFAGYRGITSLSFLNLPGNTSKIEGSVKFNIEGGKVITDASNKFVRLDSYVAKIKNYSLEVNKTNNLGFINRVDGSTIKNLKFENANITTNITNFSDDCYIGGLVGNMIDGIISNVSFNGNVTLASIPENGDKYTGYKAALGGLVGRMDNGTIYACDYNGALVGVENVGGLVGEIQMGIKDSSGLNTVNNVRIVDSYMKGSINANDKVGGIIGNIGYAKYNYPSDLTSLANIEVSRVYTNADLQVKDPAAYAYGILGSIVSEDKYVDIVNDVPVEVVVKLPIANVKFNNLITKSVSYADKGDGIVFQAQTPSAITPSSASKTLTEGEFAYAGSYTGYDIGNVWIMAGSSVKFLDLKYKYDILSVQAEIVGAATGSKIAELNKATSGQVNFINGQPIVMTINPEAGVHVNTINAVLGNRTINLFTAKTDIKNFSTDTQFYNYYGSAVNAFVKYDYQAYKLSITPQSNGNYVITKGTETFTLFTKNVDGSLTKGDAVVFEFDFSINATTKSENTYRFSAKGYADGKPIVSDASGNTIATMVNGTDYAHSAKNIQVFVKWNFEDIAQVNYSKFKLDNIKIKSRRGTEYFEERFYSKVPATVNGASGDLYTFHLERLDLYDKDAVELQFNFVARDADFNIPNLELFDVIYTDKLNNAVTTPKFYQELKIQFKLKDIYKNEYGFNLYDATAKKQYIVKNDEKIEVTFANGWFSTTQYVKIEGTSIIDINVAKKMETSVKESGVKLNAPHLLLTNVPVFDDTDTYVIGYVSVQLLYTTENGVTVIKQGVVSGTLVDDGTISADKVLLTVEGNGAKFRSLAGINLQVQIYDEDSNPDNNFYTLKSYDVDSKSYDFVLQNGVGTIDLSNYDISQLTILLYFTPKSTTVNLVRRVVYGNNESFNPVTDKFTDIKTLAYIKPYGETFRFNKAEIMSSLLSDYCFMDWYSTDVVNPTISDTTYSFVVQDNVTNVYVLLRPMYKVNFNISDSERHNGSVVHDGVKIEGEFKFALNAYDDLNNKLVFNIAADKNVTPSIEYTTGSSDDKIFVFDANAMTITVDMNKLATLRKVDSVETQNLLNVNITVRFAPKYIDTVYNSSTVNSDGVIETEQGGQITVRDGNKSKIEYTLGDTLTIKYAVDMYIETTIRNGYKLDGWYITIGDKTTKIEKGVTEHTTGGIKTSTIYLENITKDFTLTAKFIKDPSLVFHKIENIVIEEGYINASGEFVKTDVNNLAEIYFEFSIMASDTSKDKIPDGSRVEIMYRNMNKRYMFYSWVVEATMGGSVTDTSLDSSTNLGICTIDSMKSDIYKVTLRVVERTFNVKVYFDKGINIRLNNETDFLPYNANGNDITVKYGESLKLSFVASANPNYYVSKWEEFKITNPTDNSGEYSNFTSNNYDITEIANNYEIKLIVNKKIDESGSDKINKVKHAVSLEGNGTGYITVTNNGDGSIILNAVPSADSAFVKWVRSKELYSENSRITVENKVGDTYYAVFTRKFYSINLNSSDAFISDAPLQVEAGKTVVIELGVKPGYKIDKIIINGTKVIPIGNVTKFELHNVSEVQNIQVVYHKVGMTEADKSLAKAVVIVLLAAIVVAIVVKVILSNKNTPRDKRKDKRKNINID